MMEVDREPVHYFKIDGPKDERSLKSPIYARILEDSNLLIKDYQGIIHNTGFVKKGQIVEVCGIWRSKIPEISDLSFNFSILVNPSEGGEISPYKIEFLDNITINGYGGKNTQ